MWELFVMSLKRFDHFRDLPRSNWINETWQAKLRKVIDVIERVKDITNNFNQSQLFLLLLKSIYVYIISIFLHFHN